MVRLIYSETESDALERWLAEHADVPRVSSELAKVEVTRSCRRLGGPTLLEAVALGRHA